MPKTIVGLCSALICTNAMAVNAMPACADCYCCTYGTQSACMGTCYYDTSCCHGEACTEGYHWDSALKKCVEDLIILPILCESGTYNDNGECVACPGSSLRSTCDVASDTSQSGITSCYLPATTSTGTTSCEYDDNSGHFEFVQDCYYSNRLTDVEIGTPAGSITRP
ncbi:MAG: hypothetical protein K2L94_04305 [Alphaproteobacteria bacterium]|nr:hypothetical protein [Alphaproteobacteria bacterium]